MRQLPTPLSMSIRPDIVKEAPVSKSIVDMLHLKLSKADVNKSLKQRFGTKRPGNKQFQTKKRVCF